jgi:hypothetical protein
MPRPIAALDSVFLEELTWMEVRDAIHAGKTTVIIGTEGIEPNGPYVAGLYSLNGFDMSSPSQTVANGKKLVEYRANLTVAAVRKALTTKHATRP